MNAPLRETPLAGFHAAHGARMVPFAGYSMPVHYKDGIMKEHQATRESAGLFDVSHMGQIVLRPKSGQIADAARALEDLVPADIAALKPGRQRYTQFTTDEGGIIDDFMAVNAGDHLFLVVNAACKEEDEAHLRQHLSDQCDIEVLRDRALIAIQGPQAEKALASLAPGVKDMRFMDWGVFQILGADAFVSRSGYTGEDGYEVSVPASIAEDLANALVEAGAAPVGLGARDSLRLEAGLCLYGNDIDKTTTPVEAGLAWSIQKTRRQGGEREGGFPGAPIILDQIESGTKRLRAGLKPDGRAPVRAGAPLYADETSSTVIGTVTSGGFGPSVGCPVAMGYVPSDKAREGAGVFAEVRGKRLPMSVAPLPFFVKSYKR
ncbi:MAG: glycine cleavage system aminomethyltransferase GcvT [Hyphomicrobiales bacterium]|nr:glycine cleavage system aminomethyltransferase GcvT [Hyphomicrobiales bacterium]